MEKEIQPTDKDCMDAYANIEESINEIKKVACENEFSNEVVLPKEVFLTLLKLAKDGYWALVKTVIK
jgi:hypothetical protein